MRLNVLHLTDSWGPGGAETVYADLATGLDEARFSSVAGLPRATGWLHDEVCRRGLAPLVFPTSGSFDTGHVARLVRAIRQLRVDVVQAHTFGTIVYASVAGRLTGTPVVSTLHGRVDLALDARHRGIKWQLIRLGSSRVVCVSQALHSELSRSRFAPPPGRLAVIRNGVDVSTFRPGHDAARRQELGAGSDVVLIGAVGNVRRVKGYEVLLDAAALLVERGEKFRVAILGQIDNDAYPELEARRRALGLEEAVCFAGFRTDVPELLRAFDVYVLTSHSEGFPLSTIQAMASGLPTVATRCGGPEEMLSDGSTGWLVERNSPAAVAEALQRLIRDPEMRSRMGRRARDEAVERYSTSVMIEQYERLYETLAGATSSPRTAQEALAPVERAKEAVGQ